MTRTVYLDGEAVRIDQYTTGKELKELAGTPEGAELVIHSNGDTTTIQDDDLVAEQVRDGAELIVEQPNEFQFDNGDASETEPEPVTADTGSDEFRVVVDNETIPVERGTTARDLRELVGADPGELAVFYDPATDEDCKLPDSAVLEEHVPNGASISYQPAPGEDGPTFGR
jgi:hypothetical protein